MTAAEFRAFIEGQDWSQARAAEVLGATQPRISDWATGKRPVPKYIAAHVRTLQRRKLPKPQDAPKGMQDNGR